MMALAIILLFAAMMFGTSTPALATIFLAFALCAGITAAKAG